ncbi:disease resistance protein SUMM2-like [Neltuma alba]|uniref:disease resistance protein SUMM2-like n=1 Tax=Neltuma alba TaxID=207710 RepID=UPI0010A31BFA|nr:disease resistance protein SUMM2-like [Prosopis alba]
MTVAECLVDPILQYLVHPTLQQLKYLFCVGKISRNVEIGKEELILTQGRVQERVQEAINRSERIDGQVNKWKNGVKSLIAELEKLEEELRANHGCLRGWCPTWKTHCLCKKLAQTTQTMIDLNKKSDRLDPFSHPLTILGIEYHSSKDFMFFSSTQRAFDQLWKALQDDGSSMIGLWSMGGSGKTTLVKEVGKKAQESQLFNRVVLTTISQSPDIIKIQGEIADKLGLSLEEESEVGRAQRISLRLQSGERILIILDDVWAMLNLEDIGIPIRGNHQRNCKVVLTTRRLDACTLMECQKRLQLDLLKEDEAWTLFQTHANVNDATKEDMARKIAMECKGLPIVIVAVVLA